MIYKKIKINILHTIILIICFNNSYAQVFDDTQSHFNIKWNQINTEKFRLIFPNQFNSSAPTLASQIDHYLNKVSSDLNRKPHKINIIVQSNHLEQNGFVQLAPRKSELYSTPSGIADNQQWLPNLALHELRHVAQFDNLTGKIRKPFGEQLALAFFGINLPSWFYEGDAVVQETKYSSGGRGKLASWNMPLRANIQSNLQYDFNKYIHGSYKDIVPSYYTIGYFLTSEIYQKDDAAIQKIYEDMNGKLLKPFNFQSALKRFHGAKASEIFSKTMSDLSIKWDKNITENSNQIQTLADKYPTNYLLPQVVNEKIYAIMDSRQKTKRIVEFSLNNDLQSKEITTLGLQIMPYFQIQDSLIVWDEYRKNQRFQKETYNVINVYNINTNSKKTISKKSRFYTPILSPDNKKITTIHVNKENKSSLITLDIRNGNILDSISFEEDFHIQQPNYNEEGSKIIAIAVTKSGTNLVEIDINNKAHKTLLPWTNLQFERPVYDGNDIIFKVNNNDKDDIFKLSNGELTQLTRSQFGAFNPFVADGKLYYNNYTTNGYKISTADLNNINNFDKVTLNKAKSLYNEQNKTEDTDTEIPLNNYEIKAYSRLKNSLNFHSIALSGSDYDNFDNLKPGLFWISNDILNTTKTKLGYEYDNDKQKSIYSAEVTYQTFYPKITVGYKNKGDIGWAKSKSNPDSIFSFDWRENQYFLDIQVPFSINRGNNMFSYGASFGTYYINRYDLSLKTLSNFTKELAFPLNYQVYFGKNSLRSMMDLAPRWGQNISITARHSPFENTSGNYAFSVRTNFYFPGILPSHSLQARFAYQNTSGRFMNIYDIPVSEGFNYLPTLKLRNTLLLDYRLPICYPDFSIGQLAYIKRIHGLISADYLNIHHAEITPKASSIGINFDFNIFKYNLPNFTFGIKGTYLNDTKANKSIISTYSLSYSY